MTGTAAVVAAASLPAVPAVASVRIFKPATRFVKVDGNVCVYPILASFMPQPGGQLAAEQVREFERQRGKEKT